MGFKLRREVRDALPPGVLTAGERLLVLELADQCSDETREGWPGAAALAELADVAEAKVGEMFARIAKKWIELRVPLGHGKDGRPFYSHLSQRTRFVFPPAEVLQQLKAPQIGGPSKVKAPQIGVPQGPPNAGKKAPQIGGPIPSITPSASSSSSDSRPPLIARLVALGADDDDEAAAVLEKIRRENTIRGSLGAYLRGVPDDDLRGHLDELRAAPAPTAGPPPVSRTAFRDSLHDTALCPHALPGGNVPHPADGWMHCSTCRHASGWTDLAA